MVIVWSFILNQKYVENCDHPNLPDGRNILLGGVPSIATRNSSWESFQTGGIAQDNKMRPFCFFFPFSFFITIQSVDFFLCISSV
jgi:hypothetical protein